MTTGPAPLTTTMTALRAHARGGPEQLVVETVARPRPGPGQLLVEVHAAAITFAELTWEETWSRDGQDRTPVTPSHEFSGVVVGHGDVDNTSCPEGAEVFGLVPFDQDGAAADYVVVPATNVAIKPARLNHVEASALPIAAATAWQALVRHGGLRPGERVLVLGGAGGVGAFAVQMGVALGAEVTASALHSHVDYVTALGANRVLDVDVEKLESAGGDYDIVVDTVGGESLRQAFGLLRRGGRLVTLQAPPDADLAREHGVEAIFFIVAPDGDTLAEVARLADHGELRIQIAATYPLSAGREAFSSGDRSPRAPGKTVLVVA